MIEEKSGRINLERGVNSNDLKKALISAAENLKWVAFDRGRGTPAVRNGEDNIISVGRIFPFFGFFPIVGAYIGEGELDDFYTVSDSQRKLQRYLDSVSEVMGQKVTQVRYVGYPEFITVMGISVPVDQSQLPKISYDRNTRPLNEMLVNL